MKKYIVTETESNAPNYKYQEEFDTIEEAKARMLDIYHQVAIEGNFDAIEQANLFLEENEDLVKDYYMLD